MKTSVKNAGWKREKQSQSVVGYPTVLGVVDRPHNVTGYPQRLEKV
jgi:hypothetical protein